MTTTYFADAPTNFNVLSDDDFATICLYTQYKDENFYGQTEYKLVDSKRIKVSVIRNSDLVTEAKKAFGVEIKADITE